MKRFILLTILCCLVLSISAQIARDEIFEDIYTLAGYRAGEIQLESLKLLPGTEMLQPADE